MKGIPKGSQPFGRVQRQRLWQGLGQRPKYNKALRKGEFRKRSSELFSEEGRPASEGVPHYRSLIVLTSFRADDIRPYKLTALDLERRGRRSLLSACAYLLCVRISRVWGLQDQTCPRSSSATRSRPVLPLR